MATSRSSLLTRVICIGIVFLSCSLICTTAMEVSEAQQIALESSGELLPPENLVQRIEKDLKAIRTKHSEVANVKHTGKWQPGKVIVNGVQKEALDKINTSQYGPAESRSIFQNTIFLVTFTKPYNPERMREILQKEFGIEGAEPDGTIGGSSGITLSQDKATGVNTYTIMKGWGDCPSGCINKQFFTFTVGPEENSVKLVEQRGDEPGVGDEDRPVGMFGAF